MKNLLRKPLNSSPPFINSSEPMGPTFLRCVRCIFRCMRAWQTSRMGHWQGGPLEEGGPMSRATARSCHGVKKKNGFCDQTLFQDKVVIDDPESIGPFETFQPFEGQPLARFYTCRDTYVFVQSHARTTLKLALSKHEWPRNLFSFVVKNLSDTLSWCSLQVCMLIKCNTCRMHCVCIYVYSDT